MQKYCPTCFTQFGRKDEQVVCQFCGKGCCKTCTQKSRPYPNGGKDSCGARMRGTICKLCDRKFLLRNLMSQTQKMMEAQNVSISAIASSKK